MNSDLHKDHRKRVRERYLQDGLDAFEDHQILELLLFYCIPMRDTNELAHKILNAYDKNLSALFEADPADIQKKCGVSEAIAILISLVPSLARRYNQSKWDRGKPLRDSADAGEYAAALFTGFSKELFYALCLDAQRRVIQRVLISEGTVDEAAVYPREVLKAALRSNAIYIILAHNHPGGSNRPSNADIEATKDIMNALAPLNISVLDHIIVAGDAYYSFAARQLLGMG